MAIALLHSRTKRGPVSFLNTEVANAPITRRSFIAVASIVGISTLFGSLSPTEAFATTWSAATKATLNGVTFTYQSGIDALGKVTATTKITASKTVAAGTMKAQAVIVKSLNNNIVKSSEVKSNKRGTSLIVTVTLNSLAAGYRSKGRVWYSGSGWKTCNVAAMPRSLAPELSVNEHGQTLGTYEDVERGAVPDLVGIVADSGIDGYAYWEQFDAEDASDAIPVYAEDGTTQIGIFTFGDK